MTSVKHETPQDLQVSSLADLRAHWSEQLRAHGRRVTRQRLAVLTAVHEHQHSHAEEIASCVRRELPSITVQSVYVVLADLTEIQLLRKFQPPSTPALFETRTEDNHHHALCVRCGRVEDVDCAVGHAPCLTPSESHGMQILSADVVYRGICADCREKDESSSQEQGLQPTPPQMSGSAPR